MKYVLAELSDLPAIRKLMAKYHRDTIAPEDMADGFVTTVLTDEQFADLIVREKGVMLAKDGETIRTLDGSELELASRHLVIADAEKPMA